MCSLHCIVLSDTVHHSFSPSLIFFNSTHSNALHYYLHGCVLCTVHVCVRASFVLICSAQPSMNNARHITLDYNFLFPLQPFPMYCRNPNSASSSFVCVTFTFYSFPISNYFHPPLQSKIPDAAPFCCLPPSIHVFLVNLPEFNSISFVF